MEELAAILLTRKLLLFSLQELEEMVAVAEEAVAAPSWGKVEMEAMAAEAYIVPVNLIVVVVAVCLEVPPPVRELDLNRQVPVQQEAVCSRQTE